MRFTTNQADKVHQSRGFLNVLKLSADAALLLRSDFNVKAGLRQLPTKNARTCAFRRQDVGQTGYLSLSAVLLAIVEIWPDFSNYSALLHAYGRTTRLQSDFVGRWGTRNGTNQSRWTGRLKGTGRVKGGEEGT